MKLTIFKNVLVTISLSTSGSWAATKSFEILPNSNALPGITFQLRHSVGKHYGVAHEAHGQLILQDAPFAVVSGTLLVPISSIRTGDQKRDCHMREAMGISYEKSDFPKRHVCDSSYAIPKSGPNAIVFQDISFEIASVIPAASQTPFILLPGKPLDVIAKGSWTIHGTAKKMDVPCKIQLVDADRMIYRLQGTFKMILSEFGIVVKPFLFINVDDHADVSLDLLFGPKL